MTFPQIPEPKGIRTRVLPTGDGRWWVKIMLNGRTVDGAGPFPEELDALLARKRIMQDETDEKPKQTLEALK